MGVLEIALLISAVAGVAGVAYHFGWRAGRRQVLEDINQARRL